MTTFVGRLLLLVFFPIGLFIIVLMWLTSREVVLMDVIEEYFDPFILRP